MKMATLITFFFLTTVVSFQKWKKGGLPWVQWLNPPPPEADPRPTPPAFAPPLHGPGTFPASSVHARVGAGCRSMGDVSGA